MERSVKDLLGGGLRPNDPRRFLIEAMVGAIAADGVVDPREQQMMEQQIAHHPLFQGLGAAAARTLIALSNDAIKFAGSSVARVPAIAKGLPARIHRLAAFGMAPRWPSPTSSSSTASSISSRRCASRSGSPRTKRSTSCTRRAGTRWPRTSTIGTCA